MTRYLPIALGVLVIVGLTIPQIKMSDRFSGSNISAEQGRELLKQVPTEIGDWKGEDLEITDEVRKTAGAVGAVSRTYRNVRTGDEVRLWLVVGHARDISAHTPDICFPASGLTPKAAENSLYPFVFPDQPEAPFWTNTFIKEDAITGRQLVRVFWAWFNPKPDGKVAWEAPSNPRWSFGNTRALYKMYFTSTMRDPAETTEQSSCVRFAREFMPVVEDVLSKIQAGEKVEVAAVEKPKAEATTTPEASTGDVSTTPETRSETSKTPAAASDSAAPAAEPIDKAATEPAAAPTTK
jgi:hypothetical protein